MFYLTTLSTHDLLKVASLRHGNVLSFPPLICHFNRKEMFYLTTHSTHFIYGYMASDIMVKGHSDSERGNPLLPHGSLFPINSKGSFICTIPPSLCYWLEREIAQWVLSMKDRSDDPSHHERTLLLQSYISLCSNREANIGKYYASLTIFIICLRRKA